MSLSHYGFDEVSGLVVLDDGTAPYNGLMQAMDDTNRVPGVVGSALMFSGFGEAVAMSAYNILQDNFTVCFWAAPAANQTASTQGSSAARLSGKLYVVEPISGASFASSGQTVGIAVGINRVEVIAFTSTRQSVLLAWSAGTTFGSGSWAHVCVVFDSKLPTLFVNGAPVQQGIAATGAAFLAVSNVGGSSQFYNGNLDEVRVFGARLTQPSIAQLYQTDLLRGEAAACLFHACSLVLMTGFYRAQAYLAL